MVSTLTSNVAEFVTREGCIACNSAEYDVLDSGKYSEGLVRQFIDEDPWGESPLPYLQDNVWELVRCRSCQQLYQNRLLTEPWQEIRFSKWMSEAAIRAFEVANGLDKPERHFMKCSDFTKHVLRLEKLTQNIRGEDAVRSLDFGCGWGEFATIAKLYGFDAYGVDRAPDRQEASAKKGVRVFNDLEEAHAEVQAGFHVVTLFQVLEHLDNPMPLLKSIRSVMTDQGVLVLEVPNCHGITKIKTKSDYYQVHPLEHINCFTPDSLRKFAERAGFQAIPTPAAHVTTSGVKAMKSVVKSALGGLVKPTTDQYFRCV